MPHHILPTKQGTNVLRVRAACPDIPSLQRVANESGPQSRIFACLPRPECFVSCVGYAVQTTEAITTLPVDR
jgi:hypothetical protein